VIIGAAVVVVVTVLLWCFFFAVVVCAQALGLQSKLITATPATRWSKAMPRVVLPLFTISSSRDARRSGRGFLRRPHVAGCGDETGWLGYKIHTGVIIDRSGKSFSSTRILGYRAVTGDARM
jgi:hypothetical protein